MSRRLTLFDEDAREGWLGRFLAGDLERAGAGLDIVRGDREGVVLDLALLGLLEFEVFDDVDVTVDDRLRRIDLLAICSGPVSEENSATEDEGLFSFGWEISERARAEVV